MTLPSIGDVVDDKFRIERKLGEGGTSTIYEVRHVITDKKFAIKWLAPELSQNDLAVQLFVHEARVCGRFSHPNAVQIYDICRTPESYYLLMEFLDGESLETRLQQVERFSTRAACDILLPCTEALSAAHRVGIIHRDLKPSNIILCRVEGRDDEVPKIVDFGISKLSQNGRDVSPIKTTTQTLTGTPLYMAPEQVRGQPADPRFDVYALGAVLYELVAGRPPFDSEDLDDLVQRILESEPAPLDQVASVETGFAEVVARAMARDADGRYATMAEFAYALRSYGTPMTQTPSVPPGEVVRRSERESVAAPARRSWTTTSPGFLMLKRSAAAEEPEKPEEPPPREEVEAAAEPAVESELECEVEVPLDDEGVVTPSQLKPAAAVAPRADESSAELATLDELGAIVDSSASSVPNIAVVAAPAGAFGTARRGAAAQPSAALAAASVSPAPLRASQSGPHHIPPIFVPPPVAAKFAADDTHEYANTFGDVTPWVADTSGRIPRLRRKGSFGVLAVVGAALILTWYALARESHVPGTASTVASVRHSVVPEKPAAAPPETDVSAARTAPAAAAGPRSNVQPVESPERVEPLNFAAPDPIAKAESERDRRMARRAKATASSKRHSSARDVRDVRDVKERDRERESAPRESIARRASAPESSAPRERPSQTEARQSAGIPGAAITRGDF